MAKVGIIGAGAMGLAAAHYAIKEGHDVHIFEVDSIPGGMAAHFDFSGLSIERFYHFICKSDEDTFQILKELHIENSIRWRDTKMGYFINGNHYEWGNPIALLKFPLMNFYEKLRYGLFVFSLTKRKNFNKIENLTAEEWLHKSLGKNLYKLLWKRLFELKFYEHTSEISASWIATRIKRLGNSRKSMLQEELGYIKGGSQTLISALSKSIVDKGGKISLNEPVKIVEKNNEFLKVQLKEKAYYFDNVISTMPTPLINEVIPGLSKNEKKLFADIKNIGVVCVLFKLKRSVSDKFWINIIDSNIDIPGIIEFSNLRKMDANVIYVPYYMPITNPKFKEKDNFFVTEAFGYLKSLNSKLNDNDLLDSKVGRLKYSQPICTPNFYEKIPDISTSIDGLQIADTCYYYPEDRGISESIKIAKKMVQNIS